jgi:hypothetical protein
MFMAFTDAPDRSGEAMLRALFERYGKMGVVSATISKSGRDIQQSAMIPSNDLYFEFDRKGKRLRVESSDVWDNPWRMKADGKAIRVDTGWESTLRDQTGDLWTDSNFGRGGRAFSVFSWFVLGPSAMERLVNGDSEIVRVNEREIRLTSRDLGKMTLRLGPDGELQTIEYDNLAGRRDAYLMFPMWNEMPSSPLEREAIQIQPVRRIDARRFDTSIRRGEIVYDMRRKKS